MYKNAKEILYIEKKRVKLLKLKEKLDKERKWYKENDLRRTVEYRLRYKAYKKECDLLDARERGFLAITAEICNRPLKEKDTFANRQDAIQRVRDSYIFQNKLGCEKMMSKAHIKGSNNSVIFVVERMILQHLFDQNFRIVNIKSGRNCLPRILALKVFGDVEAYQKVRNEISDYLINNYSKRIEAEKAAGTYADYDEGRYTKVYEQLENMKKDTYWLNEKDIEHAVNLYNLKVIVYSYRN